ncbi:IS701 family transposase (plasmid) [Rhizobium sp. YTUHZ045]
MTGRLQIGIDGRLRRNTHALLGRGLQVKICLLSCSYRLHFLRSWSLRQTRRGSYRRKATILLGSRRSTRRCSAKRANCQTLVSLTLARDEVPVPVGLRLFLPDSWTSDQDRMAKAGVPEEMRLPRTKPEIALDEIDRRMAAGVRFGTVLADAGYGLSAAFRQGLSARNLTWAVGIPKHQKVYPHDVALIFPVAGHGRPRKHSIPDTLSTAAEMILEGTTWKKVSWRHGTKGRLTARFAALRIRIADGNPQRILDKGQQHMPGEEAWLVGEWRSNDERKYYLANLPAEATLKALAAAIKARWVCEQAHQQMKEELGLDHFEGRSWQGLHRHALMTMIAYAFLQHQRLKKAKREKKEEARPA